MSSRGQKEEELSDNWRTINNDLSLGDVPIGKNPDISRINMEKANAPLLPVQSDAGRSSI